MKTYAVPFATHECSGIRFRDRTFPLEDGQVALVFLEGGKQVTVGKVNEVGSAQDSGVDERFADLAVEGYVVFQFVSET